VPPVSIQIRHGGPGMLAPWLDRIRLASWLGGIGGSGWRRRDETPAPQAN
jgi:hypothetical protein